MKVAWVKRPWRVALFAVAGCFLPLELALLFKACARTDLNSDHLQSVVEVSDILRGNILLHHWTLALQNYYLSDTPFFLFSRLLFGQTDMAIYFAPLPIFVLFLVTACGMVLLNARDRWAQMIGLAAVLLYLGTPGPTGFANTSFYVGSVHGSTLTFSLLSWLALDRIARAGKFGRTPRFLAGYATSAFIALFSDPFVVVVFLVPTLLTLCFAALASKRQFFYLSLAGLTLALYVAARFALSAVGAAGGFDTFFPSSAFQFVTASDFGRNAAGIFFGLFSVSGAYVFGHSLTETSTIVAAFRALALAVMLAIMVRCLWRRVWERQGWNVMWILAVAMATNLGSCLASQEFATALDSPVLTGGAALRYLVPAYLFGSILTALELPEMMCGIAPQPLRWTCTALSGAGVILATSWFVVTGFAQWKAEPAIAHNPGKIAGAWLSEHGLTHGVGEYWAGLLITSLTREQVVVGAVIVSVPGRDRLIPFRWVSKLDWYQDRPQFVIYRPDSSFGITKRSITDTYGPPMSIEHVAGYNVALLAPSKP